jgi:trans-aconitate methyltransferase
METIQEIGTRCGTSKITAHSYGPVFDQLIGHWRSLPISICEIGIHFGESLQMWLDAFPLAHVYGIDSGEFTRFTNPRMTTYVCSTHDHRLPHLFESNSLDVIVDDASHEFDQQHKAFNDLWPALKPGGFYFIEDIRYPNYLESWQDKPGYQVFGRDIHGRGVDCHEDDILVVLRK